MKIVFTYHLKSRMWKRNISEDEIINVINYPDKTIKKHGKYYFQRKLDRGIIEVACEKTETHIKVLSVYWL